MTKSEYAVRVLRDRIRSGELKPGQRLRVDALAEELGVSLTPVREALRLLQAERLILYRAHQDIVVCDISVDETLEIYELRLELEPLATRMAVPRLTEQDFDELRRLHKALEAAVKANRGSEVARLNEAWHWVIYDASGSTYLKEFVRRLWDVFPWRSMWDHYDDCSKLAESDHTEIMDALERRDARRAARLMRAHMVSGRKLVLDYVERDRAQRDIGDAPALPAG
jgi:DNA-binding GntR family transcriptional regulator